MTIARGQDPSERIRGRGLRSGRFARGVWVALLLLAGAGAPSLVAQDTAAEEAPPTETQDQATDTTPDPAAGRSGYAGETPIETGDSVSEDLAQDDLDLGSALGFPWLEGVLDPWFAAKARWNQKYGLQLQFSYQALHQLVDQSPGEDQGAAGRGEFQGMWTLVGRKSGNPGALSFRVENRHLLGQDIPPTQLGREIGALSQTGTGFSDFGTALTEFSWRQTMYQGRFKFGIGKISATSWYNGFALSSPKRGFQNTALQSSLSKASPGRGFGLVAAFRANDQFGIVAGMHDANGKSDEDPFDSIDQWEFFYSVEFRWVPTSPDRMRWDQVRFQIWYQDELHASATPSSSGVTFAASRLFGDKWMPFVVAGVSDGEASLMEEDLTVGVAFAFNTAHRAARDALGIGVNWGKPPNQALRDQYTWELFYRFQLFEHIAFTPSVQLIVDPAANPQLDQVWLGGMRARFTF